MRTLKVLLNILLLLYVTGVFSVKMQNKLIVLSTETKGFINDVLYKDNTVFGEGKHWQEHKEKTEDTDIEAMLESQESAPNQEDDYPGKNVINKDTLQYVYKTEPITNLNYIDETKPPVGSEVVKGSVEYFPGQRVVGERGNYNDEAPGADLKPGQPIGSGYPSEEGHANKIGDIVITATDKKDDIENIAEADGYAGYTKTQNGEGAQNNEGGAQNNNGAQNNEGGVQNNNGAQNNEGGVQNNNGAQSNNGSQNNENGLIIFNSSSESNSSISPINSAQGSGQIGSTGYSVSGYYNIPTNPDSQSHLNINLPSSINSYIPNQTKETIPLTADENSQGVDFSNNNLNAHNQGMDLYSNILNTNILGTKSNENGETQTGNSQSTANSNGDKSNVEASGSSYNSSTNNKGVQTTSTFLGNSNSSQNSQSASISNSSGAPNDDPKYVLDDEYFKGFPKRDNISDGNSVVTIPNGGAVTTSSEYFSSNLLTTLLVLMVAVLV